MKRVLEVNVDDKGYGGVFSFVKNVTNYIDKDKFVVNVCSFEAFENEKNKSYIRQYGGEVYDCSTSGNFVIKQFKNCARYFKLLKKGHFDVVHIHSDVAYKLLLYGIVAKVAGERNIIVHSHSTGVEGRYRELKKILQQIAKHILSIMSFKKVACSKLAARWMYDNTQVLNTHIIKNGIQLNKFRYDKNCRDEYRRLLNIDSEYIIGTVARFSYQKYPEKLLDVFKSLSKINSNCKLLWVGEGDLKEKIEAKAKEYGIYNKIIFYGTTDNVEKLYQAMDVFVLTSRFEGLCIAAVEAQAAGLPCLCSAEMSDETRLYDEYISLSIKKSNDEWACKINNLLHKTRKDTYEILKESGYDLIDAVTEIEELYQS